MMRPSEVYTIKKAPSYGGENVDYYEFTNHLEGSPPATLTRTTILRRLSKDLYPEERAKSDNPKYFIYKIPVPDGIHKNSKSVWKNKANGVIGIFTLLTDGIKYDRGGNNVLVSNKSDPSCLDNNGRIKSYIKSYYEGTTNSKLTRISKKEVRLLKEKIAELEQENAELKEEITKFQSQ